MKSQKRLPVRFCTRVESSGQIKELGIGPDLDEQSSIAKKHHAKTGLKTWVWNVRTGETLLTCADGQCIMSVACQKVTKDRGSGGALARSTRPAISARR